MEKRRRAQKPASSNGLEVGNKSGMDQADKLEYLKKSSKDSSIRDELPSILFLLFLYTLQGVPLGMSATMDLILQEMDISFEKQGVFGFVTLPFSLKLLWAPIVDSTYWASFGRRKSWLVPVQILIGLALLLMSGHLTNLLGLSGDEKQEPKIYSLTAIFILLYFLAATQDIAVDGWAVTMLKPENAGYASTCNTIGQSIGYISGYTGFLGLKMYGLIDLPDFFRLWGVIFLVSTIALALVVREKSHRKDDDEEPELSVKQTYAVALKILKLPSIQSLVFYFATLKISFAACENLAQRKLVQHGLPKEHVANITLLSMPLSLILPGIITHFTSQHPLRFMTKTLLPRLGLCLLTTIMVSLCPDLKSDSTFSTNWIFLVCLVILSLMTTAVQSAVFVSQMSFFAKITDSKVGGTYMTLLNTIYNLSGTLPNQATLFLVNEVSLFGIDGFYVLAISSFVYGLIWFSVFGDKFIMLENLPNSRWSVDYSRGKTK